MAILQYVFYAIPYLLAIGLALLVIVFGGAVISRPFLPLALYVAVYFIFAQSSYGSLELRSNPIYTRGNGFLFFPILLWALLLALGWAWLGRRFARLPPTPTPAVLKWLWAWLALLVAHTVWGLMAGEVVADILGSNGFVNIVWMAPLIALMVWSARDERSLLLLARLLVLASLAKSLFGLGRLALVGGDKSNVYQNIGKLDVKLTYFDIGDNLACLLGAAVAISLLLVRHEGTRQRLWRLVYWATALLALACITLSFRRTAWGGLALALALLVWRMDARTRLPVMLAGLPLVGVGIAYAAMRRIGAQSQSSGLASFFFDLLGKRTGAEPERALELKFAFDAFLSSPIVGIGSWGHYAHANLISWQTEAQGSFLHSGVLHIAMKTGLVGLLLLAGLVWAFVAQVRRLPKNLPAVPLALALAGCCGLLFMLPDFVLGTPIPQIRTTQLIAFCLGLPLMVSAALRLPSARA